MARLRIAVPAAIAVSVIALLAPNVRAQTQEPAGSAKPAAPALEFGWAPKKSPYDNYDAPNKVWWKLSDILAAHSRTASWVQPVVRNKDMQADWHQLAAGEKTALTEWPDNRVGMIVWQGQVRISIKGQEPFVASRGFELNIPLRLPYTMQTLGDQPALWLEVHQAGDVAIYPVVGTPEKPKDIPGYTYTKVVLSGGDGVYDAGNKPYLDYYKDVVNGGVRAGAFIASDHFFMNNIRGMGVAMPPATDLGHFHVDMTEFWFVMEGKIDYQIEGLPTPFTAEAGDIVTAAMGRYHRASFSAGQMDTRVAINPFPRGLHDFPEASGGHQ